MLKFKPVTVEKGPPSGIEFKSSRYPFNALTTISHGGSCQSILHTSVVKAFDLIRAGEFTNFSKL